MIVFTPKLGRLIALEGVVTDEEAASLGSRAMEWLQDRGAHDVLRHILKDCIETHPHSAAQRTQRFSIRAVVMSESELKEALERAYTSGFHDGRKA